MKVFLCAAKLLLLALILLGPLAAEARAVDSFFDIFIDLLSSGQVTYDSTAATTFPGSTGETEIVSMSITGSASPRVVVHPPASDGSFNVDSFFDIDYRVGPAGGPYSVDSFFDVFTEVSVSPPADNPDGSRTVQTEILSMDLTAASSSSSNTGVLQLAGPPYRHRGHVTVLKSQGGGGGTTTSIDSFFDIFTELSLDGGNTFQAANGSTPVAYSTVVVPEPSAVALAVLGAAGLGACARRRLAAEHV